MSLDVSLEGPAETVRCRCDTCGHEHDSEKSSTLLFSANITHNLGKMAAEAGIYEALWRPEEMLAPAMAAAMHESEKSKGFWHEETQALRARLPTAKARDLITPLQVGLARLRADPQRFKKFDAPNGWGLYENFLPWVERYLEACEEYPEARVVVSR